MDDRRRRNVVLIGYRGSGKSSVGVLLAEMLNVPFIDTDAVIAAEAGMSITDVFASEGEEGFRRRESQVIVRVAQTVPSVLSVGGGAVLNDENMSHLGSTGTVIWLTATPEVLFSRITADADSSTSRPDLTPCGGIAEVRAVLSARAPIYRRWADATFSSDDRLPRDLAAQINTWLNESEY